MFIQVMKIRNKTGPKTDPCGTPLVTSLHPELWPFIHTFCFLPFNQSFIQSQTFPSIPCASILLNNLWCGTLSNAFAKSKYMTSMYRTINLHIVLVRPWLIRFLHQTRQSERFLNLGLATRSTVIWVWNVTIVKITDGGLLEVCVLWVLFSNYTAVKWHSAVVIRK